MAMGGLGVLYMISTVLITVLAAMFSAGSLILSIATVYRYIAIP